MSESHVSVPELLPWKGRRLGNDGATVLVGLMQTDSTFNAFMEYASVRYILCCVNPADPGAIENWAARRVFQEDNIDLTLEPWYSLRDSLSWFTLICAFKEIKLNK